MTQNQLNALLLAHKNYLDSNGVDGTRGNLTAQDVRTLNFAGRDLRLIIGVQANAAQANFQGANLSMSNWQGANLRQANLTNTQCRATSFQRADLLFANCTGATWLNVDVRGASLIQTKLDGVQVRTSRTNAATVTDEKLLMEELQAVIERYNVSTQLRIQGFFTEETWTYQRTP